MAGRRIDSCVVLALATIAMPARATAILDDGGYHQIDSASEDVRIYDAPGKMETTLVIGRGGDISALDGTSVSVFDTSDFWLNGTLQGDLVLSDVSYGVFAPGTILPAVRGNVEVKDRSLLTVYGGAVAGNVQFKDSSTAYIHGGVIQGDLVLANFSHVDFGDSTVRGNVEVKDRSRLTVFGGAIAGNVQVKGSSTAYIREGTFQGDIECQDACVINVLGAVIQGVIRAEDTGTLNLRGDDFIVNGVPVDYGPISVREGTVSGSPWRGESFSATFSVSGDAQIILSPEPSTMLLAASALFGILLYQRRG